MKYKRKLGVLAFWFAVFHSVVLMYYLNVFSINGFINSLNLNNILIFSGMIGFFGMFILSITFNKLSMLKLKRNWKKL